MANEKAMVKVDKKVHAKVAKKVAGTPQTIGQFFDEAAQDKLKSKPILVNQLNK